MNKKSLKQQLEEEKVCSNERYQLIYKLREEISELKDKKISGLTLENSRLGRVCDEYRQDVTNLMEIIRWQMNPETAKDPFNRIEQEKLNRRLN